MKIKGLIEKWSRVVNGRRLLRNENSRFLDNINRSRHVLPSAVTVANSRTVKSSNTCNSCYVPKVSIFDSSVKKCERNHRSRFFNLVEDVRTRTRWQQIEIYFSLFVSPFLFAAVLVNVEPNSSFIRLAKNL